MFRTLSVVSLACLAILVVGCERSGRQVTAPTAEPWLPTIENFAAYPYAKDLVVIDPNGHRFQVLVKAFDRRLLDRITVENFAIEVLPPADPPGFHDGPDIGVGVDGKLYNHDELPTGEHLTGPPPLFFKIHYLDGEEPSRVLFRPKNLPVQQYAAFFNAGHYKSIVLRRPWARSYSYVRFYHQHGDGYTHPLYQGWFYRCTYAYDCLPGHSIPSWSTTYQDEYVEAREDCYGRCP